MLGTRVRRIVLVGALLTGLAACGAKTPPVEPAAEAPSSADPFPTAELEGRSELGSAPSPSPSASKRPSPKPSVKKVNPGGDTGGAKPVNSNDGVPALGAGTFTAASGGTDVVGAADALTLVQYRVEMEDGIQWGAGPVWTTGSFAQEVDKAIANPLGWTMSSAHPVTYAPNKISAQTWSFQRVSGGDYDVLIRLATPGTVDKLCKAVGVNTQGIYSCRFGKTILVNLRRWLKGIEGFPASIDFHGMTINHEMGHFLGFDHMKCPGAGQVAPVMQTQTIALNGCTPNSFPFTSAGTFVQGPWASS